MNEYENDFCKLRFCFNFFDFYFLYAAKVLPKYSDMRYPDGQAVADLSEQNYIEVINLEVSWIFQLLGTFLDEIGCGI